MLPATLSVLASRRDAGADVSLNSSTRSVRYRSSEADLNLHEIEKLGARCAEGDVNAWTSLFPIIWPVLVRFINRLYSSFDQQDAEDVAQLSLEAAISAATNFAGRGLFRAWLFGIAAQQARSFFRKKTAAKRGVTLLVPVSESFELGDENATSPADAVAVSDRAGILHKAIDELPDRDRELLHLHYFGELTFAEIAVARNMNPKTVCTRLTRCKAKLLDLLAKSNLTASDG